MSIVNINTSEYILKASSMAEVDRAGALGLLEVALQDTEVKVGLLGSRYVTSTTHEGYASLDRVASVANKIFEEYRKTWTFSNEERKKFKALEEKIDSFYEKSDQIVKTSNIFTSFLNFLREFSFVPYTIRFYWNEMTRLSCYYTPEQWKQNFWFWDKANKGWSETSNHPRVFYHP